MGGGITYMLEHCFIGNGKENYQISLDNGSGKLEKTQENSNIKFSTLDSIIKKHSFTPNFIKIDTDGFDFEVIRSGIDSIKTYTPIIFFEWDKNHLEKKGENSKSIFNLLHNLGYEELIIFDNFGNLLCRIESSDSLNLEMLIEYTNALHVYYYDVLAINIKSEIKAEELVKFIKNFKKEENEMQNMQ